MSDHRGVDIVQQFFPGTGMTYDHIVNLCTLGCDRWWKWKMLEKITPGSARIMDQACGTGILTFRIAQKFPRSQIVGVDVTEEYLNIAKAKAGNLGSRNVEFILGRAEDVLPERSFNCITSSYLAKYAELGILVPNIRKMLRDGGILIMHDFTYPARRPFALLWEGYFKLLQTLGAWKYPQWKMIFDGLPGLLRETTWVSDLVRILRANHFSGITVQFHTFHTSAIVTATKDPATFRIR